MLPRVETHMRRVLQLHVFLRQSADLLMDKEVPVSPELLSGEEVFEGPHHIHSKLTQAQALYATVRSELEQVHALGAQVKDIEKGLVDFYSYKDGVEEVLLCWRIGESRIKHYHGSSKGFAGRQPVQGHVFVGIRNNWTNATYNRYFGSFFLKNRQNCLFFSIIIATIVILAK
ncbi:MAG: DUF2203 domain-containing protein [Myxococcales bacterium]|nr:MAG: DUF2203 domain-containing protein [Myxococcales bacterium]